MLGVEAAIIESTRTICWFSTFSTPPPSLQKFVDKSCCYPNIYVPLGGGGRGIMAIKQHNSRGSNVDLSGYGCQFVSPQLATLTIVTFLLYPPPARDLQHPSPPPLPLTPSFVLPICAGQVMKLQRQSVQNCGAENHCYHDRDIPLQL